MYIACPKCDTPFAVTAEQIGEYGRKVKCSRCSHIWHQKLTNPIKIEPMLSEPTTNTPLGNGVNLPALLPIKVQHYLYIVPLMLIGLIVFLLMFLFPNHEMMGSLLNNTTLTIRDVQIHHQKEDNKITVDYKIHNGSLEKVNVPQIRIRLFDKNQRKIRQEDCSDYRNIELSPEQFVKLSVEFYDVPRFAKTVDIMIGNTIDFLLR